MPMTDEDINARIDELGEQDCDELRNWLEQFAADNKRLNAKLRERGGSLLGGPLCRGCESRRRVALVVGVAAAWWFVNSWLSGGVARDIVNTFLAPDDPYLEWKVYGAVGGIASLPYLLCLCHWEWVLYKNARPGILMGFSQAWRGFRQGRGK